MPDLSDHIIAGIEFGVIRTRFPRLHGKNACNGIHGYGNSVDIVRLMTDQGAVGWGMLAHGLSYVHTSIRGMRLSELFDPVKGLTDPHHIAYDFALHDLAGQVLGLPVYAMISPGVPGRARVYDGAIYMNDLIPDGAPWGIDAVLQNCAEDYRLGYRMFKIKIGRGFKWMEPSAGLQRDIEAVSRIADAFPDCQILVDANDGYTPETFPAFLHGVSHIPLYWIEEPFPETLAGHRALREYLNVHMPRTLIADGETRPDFALLDQLADAGCLDVWLPDICGLGMTAWRARMRSFSAMGRLASPHAWGEPLKTHYCAHLAAAYPQHIPCVEGVLGDTEGVCYNGYTLAGGMMALPDRPGFGMTLYWFRPAEAPVAI